MKKLFSLFLASCFALIALTASAAAFDANDYDYSYDYDSGSDWDWDSDNDWSWDDDDDDYYYGGTYSGDNDDNDPLGEIIGTGFVIILILIFIVGPIILNLSGGKTSTNTPSSSKPVGGGVRPANGGQGRNVTVPDRTGEIEQIIKKDDPNFTADDFTSFAKEVYIDIQNAWCARDLTTVRPVMHNNLYNTTQKQVQSKIDQKVIYHYESIAINTAYLTSYVRDKQFEYLTVYLNARFIDYQTSEETGEIIRGDKNTRWDFRYKMKFMRTVGVKTNEANSSDHGHNCPNCGAPLEMSSSGQCAYCGSVVTSGLYSWVLSDFTTVRNDTKDDGIRVDNSGNKN